MISDRYRQLDFYGIRGFPNDITKELKKAIPKFSGNGIESAENHCINLKSIIQEFEEFNEDVYMKLFAQSLIEDAAEWFRSLPDGAISSWDEFVNQFTEQFGNQNETSFASHEITSMKKNQNETVAEFNKRFNKVLNKIPREIQPVDDFLINFYMSAFDSKTNYEIRSHKPQSLAHALKIAMMIENDRRAAGIITKREDNRLFNPKEPKQQKDEDKFDKLMNMVKNLQVNSSRDNFRYGQNNRMPYKSDKYRLQDMPYKTEWKDGKPVIKELHTPDPLGTNNHFMDDQPWCEPCKLPHSAEHCMVAQSLQENDNYHDNQRPTVNTLSTSPMWSYDDQSSSDEYYSHDDLNRVYQYESHQENMP
jgi:uncharacterized FlaG/YvyC family protein